MVCLSFTLSAFFFFFCTRHYAASSSDDDCRVQLYFVTYTFFLSCHSRPRTYKRRQHRFCFSEELFSSSSRTCLLYKTFVKKRQIDFCVNFLLALVDLTLIFQRINNLRVTMDSWAGCSHHKCPQLLRVLWIWRWFDALDR